MAMSLLDDPGLDSRVNDAIQKSIAGTFAAGRPVTRDVGGIVSKVYPDGRVEPVKPTPTGRVLGFSPPRTPIKPDRAGKRKLAA